MSVLDIADAKTYLRITGDSSDTELQATINAAEAAIAQRVGPLEPTTVTVRLNGRADEIALPVTPIVSLTSLTPDAGDALDLDGIYTDLASGVISYSSGTRLGATYYTAVYVAGRDECPADLLLAVKELVRHLWATRRGAGVPTGSPVSETTANTIPGAAYIFPFRVEQLLAPHDPMFGFA